MLDFQSMISQRSQAIDASGIRRVFELGAKMKDPINFSIGQPDFPVPEPLKEAAMKAIADDRNGYTLTQGIPELRKVISDRVSTDVGWDMDSPESELIVTSGTSGAIHLAMMALLDPGDEVIAGDPYFVAYPELAELAGAKMIPCTTYPDFRLTAERVEPLITDRTKILLLNSPGNPSGVVLRSDELRELVDLCHRKNILLISDEIYDEFTYEDARENGKCPSPARYTDQMLLVRGFGKSYGCTGWRMGYAAGPTSILQAMAKVQQYTFVCAPSMAQHGLLGVFDVDMSAHVAAYQRKRDMVVEAFSGVASLPHPGGAFYGFVQVPEDLGISATVFAERAIEQNVLTIPGKVFSKRDTHFRLSFATSDEKLREGLDLLLELMVGASATR